MAPSPVIGTRPRHGNAGRCTMIELSNDVARRGSRWARLLMFLRCIPRFFVMGAVVGWYALIYGLGRVRTWFVPKAERRVAVGSLRGRILRRLMTSLGATFVKLGLVLSTRPDLLDPEMIAE